MKNPHCDSPDAIAQASTIQSYAICATARSGSTLLSRALSQTGLAGEPREYFNPVHMNPLIAQWGVSTSKQYARRLVQQKSSNGWFGLKIHIHQMHDTLGARPLSDLFPGMRYLAITRKDKDSQAVSHARALQTGQWTSDHAVQQQPVFNYALIAGCYQRILLQENQWEEYFASHNITPLRLLYEDLAGDYAGTIQAVLRFLGLADESRPDIAAPAIRKQRDTISEQWLARFRNGDQAAPPARTR